MNLQKITCSFLRVGKKLQVGSVAVATKESGAFYQLLKNALGLKYFGTTRHHSEHRAQSFEFSLCREALHHSAPLVHHLRTTLAAPLHHWHHLSIDSGAEWCRNSWCSGENQGRY